MRQSFLLMAAIAIAATPAMANPEQGTTPAPTKVQDPAAAERAAVQAVLSEYKSAIERLDGTGTERLFTADSAIFETGGSEGTYANYLGHHLGPELGELKSFKFSDYKVAVQLLGPDTAHAVETYKYRIETKAGELVDRIGVATSVLRKEDGQWKILVMHNSGRRPRAS